jgi:SAM-dependent methyltransferase
MMNAGRTLEQTLQEEYRARFQAGAAYRMKVWKILCESYFSQLVPRSSRLLDVGCGWGEFINQIDVAEKLAMDLNPDAKAHLASDVRFLHQDCSKQWPLETGSLDVVFSSNFLEHLPDKAHIEATLAEAHRTLKPGGQIILLGPNIRFLPGTYWDFWDHHVAISDRSIAEMLALTGFKVVTQVDKFLPYTMSGGREPPLLFVQAYLRAPLLWRLFGKQFLVVGKR